MWCFPRGYSTPCVPHHAQYIKQGEKDEGKDVGSDVLCAPNSQLCVMEHSYVMDPFLWMAEQLPARGKW